MRTRDTIRRCFICTKLGHLAKNYMNTRRIEDEKKEKVDNIRKQMRQQWVPKSIENASPSCDEQVTQELGDSTFPLDFSKEKWNQDTEEDI